MLQDSATDSSLVLGKRAGRAVARAVALCFTAGHRRHPHGLPKKGDPMSQHVCNGATLRCSFGLIPSTLTVLPANRVMTSSQPAATVMDSTPFVNIMPFGMCTSLANPSVASATSAAMGALTPMPCTPVTPAPWAPGTPTVTLAHTPSLDTNCKLSCVFGGVIDVVVPGQFTHQIP
jgi:hypothetical protein